MALAYYLHNLNPFIWEITPGFGPRWYGFAYVMAFLAGYLVYRWLAERGYSEMPPEKVADFITWGALFGVLIGGRLGSMIFYNWSEWIHDPLMIFRVWEGGMASHGGILGLTVFTWWFARRHHLSWTSIGDNLCVVAPIGLFFGRLANFVNGELYGRAASGVSWAVQFPKELYDNPGLASKAGSLLDHTPSVAAYAGKLSLPEAIVAAAHTDPNVREVLRGILTPRYPSQLIEAALEGVVLFCALWALRTLVKVPRGVLTGAFFILYAMLRIAGEQFRQPGSDSPFAFVFGFMTYGQLLSLFLILIGIGFLVWGFRTRQYERAFEPRRLESNPLPSEVRFMTIDRETVIFVDIRNFSVHRQTLGRHQHAKVMTHFVKGMLNHAVEIFNRYAARFENDSIPLLNHTGDGFVLVIQGSSNPVLAFVWISKFEEVMAAQLRDYERQVRTLLGEHGLPKLDFGVGIHYGPVSTFSFKAFTDKKNRESRVGFLGTPANIASRVEQFTKEYPYRVLCTKRTLDAATIKLSEPARDLFRSRFVFVGAQTLRGMPAAYRLYGFKGGFHRLFKRSMLRKFE